MRAYHSIRRIVGASLRAILPASLYQRIAESYGWALVAINYWLMRSGRFGVRAWPEWLHIEGTNICNAACVFCAYPMMKRGKGWMGMGTFRRVVDEYVAIGGWRVDLTPIVGEPFADRFFFDRLDYLFSRPEIEQVSFYTNAIIMDAERASALTKYYDERLRAHISFGGFTPERYKAIMGVDKFHEATANISTLLMLKYVRGKGPRIDFALRNPRAECGGEFWSVIQLYERAGQLTISDLEGWGFDSWAGTIKEKDLIAAGLPPRKRPEQNGPCHRLLTSPVVLADGRVNACACRDVEAELIIGNAREQSLEEILRGPELHRLLEQHQSFETLPEVCKRCTFYESIWPGMEVQHA